VKWSWKRQKKEEVEVEVEEEERARDDVENKGIKRHAPLASLSLPSLPHHQPLSHLACDLGAMAVRIGLERG